MKRIRAGLTTVAALALLGCAPDELDPRTAAIDGRTGHKVGGSVAARAVARAYDVRGIDVTVPDSLVVAVDNSYYPNADVVWYGEPDGDRRAQVRQLFLDGFRAGTAGMRSGEPVRIEVQVARFHAVTQRTRYTIGGVYSIKFFLTVKDAATGAILDGPRYVSADKLASGGALAIAEEAQGLTQKVVVESHLSAVIMQELTRPVVPPTPK